MDEIKTKSLWQEICFILHTNTSNSISEDIYEQKVIQSLEKMGWSSFQKEIIARKNIQFGSAGKLIPDLIVKSSSEGTSFVIEVKKPSVDIESYSFKNQLFSYMRQLKLEYGILIGSKILIYYDGKFNPEDNPILLNNIEFSEHDKNSYDFISLFSKETFSAKNIENYAENQIRNIGIRNSKNKLIELLFSPGYKHQVRKLIEDDLSNDWDGEIINSVLNSINIYISNKSSPQENLSVNSPQINNTSIKEIKIGQLVRSKMNNIIKYCEQYNQEEMSKLQNANYSKVTFGINHPFLLEVTVDSPKQDRYWKDKYIINSRYFVVTSEWFKSIIPNFKGYIDKISRSIG